MQIFLAKDIAIECRESQEELWDRICRDGYMKYAVEECFSTIKYILLEILDGEGRTWYVWFSHLSSNSDIGCQCSNLLLCQG